MGMALGRVIAAVTVMLGSVALLAVPSGAGANVPFKQIITPGPLESIWIGADLSCQVKPVEDSVYSFFPSRTAPGDCGAIISTAAGRVSPDWDEHDGSAADGSAADGTPYTLVSQTPVTGTGTAGDPYKIVTVAGQGAVNDDRVTRTDTYVTGATYWTTTLTVSDRTNNADATVLYHAGDCFLAESDVGYGASDPATGSVFCTTNANNTPPGRVIGFGPAPPATTTGANFVQGSYRTDVWQSVNGLSFSNICAKCSTAVDNGAGLSWAFTVPSGGSKTVSFATTAAPPPPPCGGLAPTAVGTSDADILVGTEGNDVIAGGGGDDQIGGSGGKDVVCGGDGNDTITGLGKKDILYGEAGNDLIKGGTAADKVIGGAGDDRLFGEGGRDRIKGGGGNDFLHGGGGPDQLKGGPGRDNIRTAGDFNDKINCGGGKDKVKADRRDRVSGSCELIKGRKPGKKKRKKKKK